MRPTGPTGPIRSYAQAVAANTGPDMLSFWDKMRDLSGFRLEAGEGGARFAVDPAGDTPYHQVARRAMAAGPSAAADFYVLMRTVLDGPKVFRPTTDQADALSRVLPHVPWSDYRQPFPTFSVELPEPWRHGLAGRPVFVTACRGEGYLVFSTALEDGYSLTLTLVPRGEETVEGMLSRARGCHLAGALAMDELEEDTSARCARIAVNACLLLTRFGARDLGADNQSHLRRLESRLAKADLGRGKQRSAEVRAQIDALPRVYGFRQEVSLSRRRQGTGRGPGEPSGRHIRPHWRCGHIRMQAVGEGRAERKLVFIEPVLVNAHLLAGPPGATLVTYTGGWKEEEEGEGS